MREENQALPYGWFWQRSAVLAALVILPLLVFPGGVSAKTRDATTTVRFVVAHRNVLLGWLPMYIAQEKGFYRKNHVKVDYINGSGGGSTVRMLSTRNADLASPSLPAAILAARSDPNIEWVGVGWHSASVLVWIAPKKIKVNGPKDLAGGTLGYSRAGSNSQYLAQESVRLAHIPNVKFAAVGGMGDNWAAAKSGVITAGWALEPFVSMKVQSGEAKVVLDPSRYIKNYNLEGIDVNRSFAKAHPAAIRAILKALDESIAYIKAHPDEAATVASSYLKVPRKVALAGVHSYIRKGVWDMHVYPASLTSVVKGMREMNQLSKNETVDLGKLLHQEYLPRDLRASLQ